ncbi:MAG TPA: crotonase/enoyl-CoA hydratase family protein [Burkholderiales bacterium]
MNARVDFGLSPSPFEKKYHQIETRFDPEHAIAWTYLNPAGAPCFNPEMLEELRAHDAAIQSSGGRLLHGTELHQIRYYVGASRSENVFSLGGNLNILLPLIRSGDRETLMHYSKLCIDALFPRICAYHSQIITISLVQGEALGGGFETALSSGVIVAEKRARMGMPEIMFNLFPGMGAYSLLARRVGMRRAEEIILSGRIYTAAELHEMGVVDVLVEDGTGESAVYDYVRQNERRRNGLQAVLECRQYVNPISYEELLKITTLWVDAALRLEEKDLKLMSRLARSQLKRGAKPLVSEPVREPELATA